MMKTIGLLGGNGWSSTITYYKLINELVAEQLGGYHSAKILLKSIDYHDIMSNYGKDHEKIASLLEEELKSLLKLNPDCVLVCCNSLHKYLDKIRDHLDLSIPLFHAVHLVGQHLLQRKAQRVLLLATAFTMEDGFFAKILQDKGVDVVIPDFQERQRMQKIHGELMQNLITQESKEYFEQLIRKYSDLDAVVLGCTEYPLIVNEANSVLPIVDPVVLQVAAAVDYALK